MKKTPMIVILLLFASSAWSQELYVDQAVGTWLHQKLLNAQPTEKTIDPKKTHRRLMEITAKAREVYGPRGAFPSGNGEAVTAALLRDGVLKPGDEIEGARAGTKLRLSLQNLSPQNCHSLLLGFPWEDHAFGTKKPDDTCQESRLTVEVSQ